MTTVQVGKALVPASRLREFTGQKKTMAELEVEMRPPPSAEDQMLQRIKALEEQVTALRRLIALGQSAASATQTRRMEVRDRESQMLQRLETIFFRMYSGTKISLSTIMSSARSRAISDARAVLICSIVKAEPSIAYVSIAARYAKHATAVHYALRRYAGMTPSQKRNVEEIVQAYIAASAEGKQP
jgi:hypothetical protein